MSNSIRISVFALSAMGLVGIGCSGSDVAKKSDGKPASVVDKATSKWEGSLVRRPGNTPEDGKVYVVQGGIKRWVISGEWLKLHGYKFPDDVKVISVEELAAIPLGPEMH